jgi:4-amino-4-deoxy-L-arabinose transferase-like glycosyltransferase
MNNSKPESSGEVRWIRRVVAFLGIFLILLGQFLIYSSPLNETVVFPPQNWLSVVGVILFLISQVIPSTPWTERLAGRLTTSAQMGWIFAALMFSILATVGAELFQVSTRTNYIPVLTVWLLGALAYVAAFTRGAFTQMNWKVWFKRHRNEILLLLFITLIGAVVRFYKLGAVPRVLDGDEGRVGMAAQTTVLGDLTNPFALWDNFGALYLQLINLSMKFFGPTAFGLRLLPAIGGTLAVPCLYLLARQVGGRRVAFIAAFLLATSHTHINFSRIASVAYIHGTWLVPLELYFLLSGLEKRQAWRTALSGVILAIHFSVYLTAQVVTAMILVYMLIAFLFLRSWFKPLLREALAFWGGLLLILMPEVFYVFRTPEQFFNRLVQDGTFSGWLANTMQSTGQSAVTLLSQRVLHAFLSLIYYPSLDFYGSPVPMLSMIAASMFLLGLGISLWRTKSPKYLLLNGNFWAATLSVGLFAVPPSADSYRMLMALPAAMIMAAIGLDQVLEYFGLGWEQARGTYSVVVGAVLTSLLIFNLWTYYGDFAGQCRYGDNLAGRFASYLGSYVKTVDSQSDIYLLSNEIYLYGTHASTYFLSQSRPVTNLPAPIDSVQFVSGETIIASPDRIPELLVWAHEHPGGKLQYQYDCQRTILLAYQVP